MHIRVYRNVQDMDGLGEEWLIDDKENVIAVFYEGNLVCKVYHIHGVNEKTKIAL